MSELAAPQAKHRIFNAKRCFFWLTALLAFAAVTIFSAPCDRDKSSSALAFILMTAIVMGSFWEAHIKAIRLDCTTQRVLLWQICKNGLWNLFSLFCAALLGVLLTAFFIPTYSCYTDRARVSEMLMLASDLKISITERINETNTLENAGSGLQVKAEGRVVGGFVTDSGTIILISENPPAVVTMAPQIVNAKTGESKWTCLGYPQRLMPLMCREELAK